VTTEQNADNTKSKKAPKSDGAKGGAAKRSEAAADSPKAEAAKSEAPAKGQQKGEQAKGGAKTPRAAKPESAPIPERKGPLPPARLAVRYKDEVAATLFKEFGYSSTMQIPRLEKIIVNVGIGAEAITNAKAVEAATKDITTITGQKPITTRARKSIATFKIRQGMPMGITVTLRGRRMYEFYDRLVSSALPRIRDFRGVPRNAFDGRGNYALGLKEQVMFPEIEYNSIDRMRGLQIVIVTTAASDREGFRLMELLGMPFEKSVGSGKRAA